MGTLEPVKVLLIADDLTGACDAAAQFRRRGATTRVALGGYEPCEVLAVSTDSRGLPAAVSEARIGEVAARAGAWQPEVIFKKIDSLWRGDQTTEIRLCQEAFGCDEAIITPAFPAMGRRVVGGKLLVDSLPAWQPLPVAALDASTDADLDALVDRGLAASRRVLWAGSAGLAAALARRLFPASVLFCIGSEHEVTRQQLAALGGHDGYRLASIPWGALTDAAVLAMLARERFTALLLTGGDTAAQVCRAIGATGITLEGEIVTGLPWGRLEEGLYNGMPVATKSGAFGGPDALLRVLRYFVG